MTKELLELKLLELKLFYKEYKHLDDFLSDKKWAGNNIGYSIASDLWQAIKKVVKKINVKTTQPWSCRT